MVKEQKEVTVCKKCELGIDSINYLMGLGIVCLKTEKIKINYIDGTQESEFDIETQSKWNNAGKCPHYKPKDYKKENKSWYKKLFKIK